jgi:periplasmic protein TonB
MSLKLHVIQSHDTSGGGGPVEQAYTPPPVGNENGVPTAAPTVAPTEAATAPPTPSGPVVITDSDFINKVDPDYPEMAKEEGAQGDVQIRITIGPQGQVLAAEIASSSGNPQLDQAALKAAKESTFKPPLVNGVPTQRDYIIDYTFSLDQ